LTEMCIKRLLGIYHQSGRKQLCLSVPWTMGEIRVSCSLVCSVFLLPHLLVVVFYYVAFLCSSCKIFSGQCCYLLSWEELYPYYFCCLLHHSEWSYWDWPECCVGQRGVAFQQDQSMRAHQ